jgi:hypothetical protein
MYRDAIGEGGNPENAGAEQAGDPFLGGKRSGECEQPAPDAASRWVTRTQRRPPH